MVGIFSGSGDNDPNPDSQGGILGTHGTQCAGIIAAKSNNNLGYSGIAGGWNAQNGIKIMPLKESSMASVIEAIYYAVNNGANIISFSGGWSEGDAALEDAVNYAFANDVVFIVSVGNDNTNAIAFPAAYSSTIAVGGVDTDDLRWVGQGGSNWGLGLDIMAPSGWRDIFCLIPYSDYSFQWYEFFGGTSAAAPHVAGEAALIKSLWPNKNIGEIKEIIIKSSEKIEPYVYDENGWNEYVGYGRINIGFALAPPSIPQNFTVSGDVGEHPVCDWTANSEPDLTGYKLYKNEAGSGWSLFRTLNKSTTSYTDMSVTIGQGGKGSDIVCYKVSAVDITDQESDTAFPRCKPLGSVSKEQTDIYSQHLPDKFSVDPAFPNPFNPSTSINYQIPIDSNVSIRIFNLEGRLIMNLVNLNKSAGYYSTEWNGFDKVGKVVASGVYLVVVDAYSLHDNSEYHANQKVILIK